ncbi:MAG: geranylgeranylglycerol-phosphate geranylgeranyltransferase [candidate division Zixibacteria bacterium]|nr:geranylgeranylglycerol-phosphate geranylgeranyltransferase [candidate division Zixibacteria bacterium]
MRTALALLRLTRVHNALMAGVGVWLGGFLAGMDGGEWRLILASVSAALVCGAGNAFNDFKDIEVDRINHPRRPLPAGDLQSYQAILAASVMNLVGLIIAGVVGSVFLLVVAVSVALLFVYNFSLKKKALWGNLVVALLGALTFIAGGLVKDFAAVRTLPGPAIPAGYAFLFHFGRELVKDIADDRGDRNAHYRTLPMLISHKNVVVLITAVYLVLILLAVLPIGWTWYTQVYTYLVIFGVSIPLMAIVGYLIMAKSMRRFVLAGGALKILMVAGLLAFLLGRK